VVDALRCAVEIQRGMAERNIKVPEEKRIELRIGVNLGDVIIDSGDIFGNGVNVAVRLEGIANPGGICVSGLVQEYAQDQLDVLFEDAGEHHLKNIARPVRAYHLRFDRPAKIRSALTVPSKPSIAVLPFQNLGDDPGHRREDVRIWRQTRYSPGRPLRLEVTQSGHPCLRQGRYKGWGEAAARTIVLYYAHGLTNPSWWLGMS